MFRINHPPAVFGVGSTAVIGDMLKQHGVTRAFFVYDPAIGELGLNQGVKEQLEAAGIPYAEFSDIPREPDVPLLDEASRVAREFGADGVIGLGGGSSMDISKCMGLMLREPESKARDMIGATAAARPHDTSCPVFLLPTTAGTSAEVTPYYVIFDPEENIKTAYGKFGGNYAIIDPEYTLGLPPKVTAQTGMDLLAHVIESITGPGDHWMDDLMSKEAISIAFRNLPIVFEDGKNLTARTQMSYACLLAGYAMGGSSCHIGHRVADCISRNYHYAHGVGCCAATPITLRYAAKVCPDKLQVIAEAMGLRDGRLETVLEAYRSLMARLGMKDLREIIEDKAVEDDLYQYSAEAIFYARGVNKEACMAAIQEELESE